MIAAAAAFWGAVPERLLRERENAVWRVILPDGRGAALRLHRVGYQTEASIRSELWWCGGLAAAGLPVPAPVAGPEGEVLHRMPDGRWASMLAWVEGQPMGEAGVPLPGAPAGQVQLHRDLGRLLSRVHAATDAMVLPAWFERPRWDAAGLLGEEPFWGRFWEHPLASTGQAAVLIQAREWLAGRIAEHRAALGPIHADVLRENVLVAGRRLSLIDFDDSGIGWRLYDLGTVLSQCLAEPAFPDIRAALMEGYGTADGAMVDAFTLMRCCSSVGWTMPRLGPDDPVHARHIARAVAAARRFGAI